VLNTLCKPRKAWQMISGVFYQKYIIVISEGNLQLRSGETA